MANEPWVEQHELVKILKEVMSPLPAFDFTKDIDAQLEQWKLASYERHILNKVKTYLANSRSKHND